jgi:riboflavin synthase
MFAGIVEALGRVVRVGAAPRRDPSGAQAHCLAVHLGALLADLQPGASVAINGVCLTLTERGGPVGSFDVVPETWRNTTLHTLNVGDRIDGHFVQGHVDGIGVVERVERAASEWKLWILTDPALMPCIIRKGSIALDGTSLTVVDAERTRFSVVLIPTTLERTVLGQRRPGDPINIETDILARLVVSRLAAAGLGPAPDRERSGITFEHLREGGFL